MRISDPKIFSKRKIVSSSVNAEEDGHLLVRFIGKVPEKKISIMH